MHEDAEQRVGREKCSRSIGSSSSSLFSGRSQDRMSSNRSTTPSGASAMLLLLRAVNSDFFA